ncbi:hypothetical protein HMF7854_14625 [Sphingomonas ginkgonis]|uniref:Uncharacterized protein n=1 Tax=Sphingomonas ginkgonis TaxID=2315330 RepID=A0A3R9YP53_9SPHN|nr:hypothetical protein [Sphingomonas ginkgonis]RST31934.1 hypothetical protein HMF7854_14625 [Sphingomonas ginkgonis]
MIAADLPAQWPPSVELRRVEAAEARQGVVAGERELFAVSDRAIGRYDRSTGRRTGMWRAPPGSGISHVNSCILRARLLVCAVSNYPALPQRSHLLWIDADTLILRSARSLDGPGSLTFADWHADSWWVGYANYDGRGGMPGRDHRATLILRLSPDFVERQRFTLPATLLARIAPRSVSGGAWRGDWLLLTGHDRHEGFAVRLSPDGQRLVHVATVPLPTPGQAIAWDPGGHLWSIDRPRHALVESLAPPPLGTPR